MRKDISSADVVEILAAQKQQFAVKRQMYECFFDSIVLYAQRANGLFLGNTIEKAKLSSSWTEM
jgi:hypothetical protein